MATQKIIRDMITLFCELFGKKMADETLGAWEMALQRYQDNQVISAGQKVMEEFHRMPTPADLIERIRAADPPLETYESHEMRTHCSKCGTCRYCRRDSNHPQYECEDCYTGLTREERIQRVKDFTKTLKGGLFKSMDEAA